MIVKILDEVKSIFPDIRLCVSLISDVIIRERDSNVDNELKRIEENLKSRFSLDSLKDNEVIKAYRNFYWRIGIDPTKQRPAVEALIRRILHGQRFPTINSAVDCINLASIQFMVSISAYDLDKISGSIILRWSREGEKFIGIGDKEAKIIPKQLVLADDEKILGLYPHRDSELSKITHLTKRILMISCGVPGVPIDVLFNAIEFASKLLERYCHGQIVWINYVY
ncbi:MAG: phenylalanine--tRNA ligase beta subunit-related protein [Candidatus Methanomethylicia archaeon]|nr:phenylalanine--tRNA ligase beta subunit-related protein [Candidatus Methanomethylicia archaeon]